MAGPLSEGEIRAIVRNEVLNGQAGVLIRQLQGMLRRGTGSPEGVVDAPKGVVYQDDSSGDVYRKTTAAGTLTGWTTNFP